VNVKHKGYCRLRWSPNANHLVQLRSGQIFITYFVLGKIHLKVPNYFDLRYVNFKTFQTRISNFQNVSITDTLLGFVIKSYKNFQNILARI
jgi:hypothetical protein